MLIGRNAGKNDSLGGGPGRWSAAGGCDGLDVADGRGLLRCAAFCIGTCVLLSLHLPLSVEELDVLVKYAHIGIILEPLHIFQIDSEKMGQERGRTVRTLHFVDGGFLHLDQVGGCGLKGVEEEPGFLGIDLVGEQELHDLGEDVLDGVRILEDRHLDAGVASVLVVEVDVLALPAGMEETEASGFFCGGAAGCAIDLGVFATRSFIKRRHDDCSPPLPLAM
jgi:hypothetical protein